MHNLETEVCIWHNLETKVSIRHTLENQYLLYIKWVQRYQRDYHVPESAQSNCICVNWSDWCKMPVRFVAWYHARCCVCVHQFNTRLITSSLMLWTTYHWYGEIPSWFSPDTCDSNTVSVCVLKEITSQSSYQSADNRSHCFMFHIWVYSFATSALGDTSNASLKSNLMTTPVTTYTSLVVPPVLYFTLNWGNNHLIPCWEPIAGKCCFLSVQAMRNI